ncbi:MAG: DVUA0089 family protein [Acidobacteriaceae bacterium]|nr:DVUA0089 family protein [Acidobacteriaceae bacterium]
MLLSASILIFTPEAAQVANITLDGLFTQDNNVQLFNLTISTAGTVDIRSYGYAGGTTSTGTVVPAGGFGTILSHRQR